MKNVLLMILAALLAVALVLTAAELRNARFQLDAAQARIAWCEAELERYCGDYGG